MASGLCMGPAGGRVRRAGLALLLALLALPAAGCGRRSERARQLSFEELTDTTGLTRGAPILTSLEPYRITGRAIRIRGTAELPDGARLQIAIVRVSTGEKVQIAQVTVEGHAFETGPLMTERGPIPEDLYRFEVSAQFNAAWQPPEVLRATGDGRALRGPGVTRGNAGQAGLFLAREMRL